MDYSRRELADRLAAEYVLGTLRGPARRRMEALLPAHPTLRQAVDAWQQRLLPLSDSVPPVPPSAAVWQGLEARLFPDTAPAQAPAAWWRRLPFWQGLSGLALAGVVGLAVLQATPRPEAPPIVIVMAANPGAGPGAIPASFVASLSADGRSLVLKPVNVPAIEATRALELWAVPAEGAPRSLGLVSAERGATIQRAGLLAGTAAFAVSLEPAGGSPTGAPSGPILSLGKVQL
jgi:anti-sigma-K factor RskA